MKPIIKITTSYTNYKFHRYVDKSDTDRVPGGKRTA